jgi:hypothetical protein
MDFLRKMMYFLSMGVLWAFCSRPTLARSATCAEGACRQVVFLSTIEGQAGESLETFNPN